MAWERDFIVSLCETRRAAISRRFGSSSSSFLGLPHPSSVPPFRRPSSFVLLSSWLLPQILLRYVRSCHPHEDALFARRHDPSRLSRSWSLQAGAPDAFCAFHGSRPHRASHVGHLLRALVASFFLALPSPFSSVSSSLSSSRSLSLSLISERVCNRAFST